MCGEFLFVCELLLKSLIRLLRSLSFHDSDAVHDSMHMRVDSDIRCIIQNCEYHFCSLYADSWE